MSALVAACSAAFSVSTYLWINASGEKFWVKYHFKTDQGIEFFTQDEADQMASADTDYHQRARPGP
jgi:catalase